MSPLWSPSSERIEAANITEFTRLAETCAGERFPDYHALQQWSVADRESFWDLLWDFAGIVGDRNGSPAIKNGDLFPGTQWFPGSRLNYAENLLRRRDSHIAIIERKEDGTRTAISYAELYVRVARLAEAFSDDGIRPGDCIAGYMPNCADTVVAMLAATAIGAVWTSCSPDFGELGLLDRFGQVAPEILVCADGYQNIRKSYNTLDRAERIAGQIPSIKRVVVCPYICQSSEDFVLPKTPLFVALEDYAASESADIQFYRAPFEHPLFILYSSGTTDKPKCIVHCAGGTLLEHQKEHLLQTDLGADDVFFYYTTCGWMMWNWLVSGLACGASVILYDGSPFVPRADHLFEMAAQEKITVFGTAAKYIAALQKKDIRPGDKFDLSALKTLLSTGSPLIEENFHYVYDAVKQDLLLSSISGGTDILGAFASGAPNLPVYAGELQCAGLALDVQVWNDAGEALQLGKGELVCAQSFPTIPIGFWNDDDGSRFHKAYFDRFNGVWAHGDFAAFTEHHGMIIFGRSDALLNPGGVRIGTAEIYRQVERVTEVCEAICVGQDWNDDCRVLLFVMMQPGCSLNDEIIQRIKTEIRTNTTPRHVPAKILEVDDIPRTMSGKLVELAVREVIHNRVVKNKEAIANPEALELFRNLEALTF